MDPLSFSHQINHISCCFGYKGRKMDRKKRSSLFICQDCQFWNSSSSWIQFKKRKQLLGLFFKLDISNFSSSLCDVFFFVSQEASIFFFDKRIADKIHKPKRKETISELLRVAAKQLDRYRHPRILSLIHPVEETHDTLAFASEPVLGSLANVLGSLEDRLPQNISTDVRTYQFLDFEIKYGILQLVEALTFLHTSCKIIHRNLCPQSVIITRKGTWKLTGFEFIERCNDADPLGAVHCQSWSNKIPKMGQPDLDFIAPEIQSTAICSPASDMFSLGLLVYSIYNHGKSPLESTLNPQNYLRQLEILNRCSNELLLKVDPLFQEATQALLDMDPRRRPTSQTFSAVSNQRYWTNISHLLTVLSTTMTLNVQSLKTWMRAR